MLTLTCLIVARLCGAPIPWWVFIAWVCFMCDLELTAKRWSESIWRPTEKTETRAPVPTELAPAPR